jgi:hypothetical protein
MVSFLRALSLANNDDSEIVIGPTATKSDSAFADNFTFVYI